MSMVSGTVSIQKHCVSKLHKTLKNSFSWFRDTVAEIWKDLLCSSVSDGHTVLQGIEVLFQHPSFLHPKEEKVKKGQNLRKEITNVSAHPPPRHAGHPDDAAEPLKRKHC